MSEEEIAIQLQTVSKSNTILFTALAGVLEKTSLEYRLWFCRSLRDEIQELLEIDGRRRFRSCGVARRDDAATD